MLRQAHIQFVVRFVGRRLLRVPRSSANRILSTPMWLGNVLVPGEDTVWLNVPFSTQPDGWTEDTSTPDGNNTGFVVNSVRVVANNEFLAANPALAARARAVTKA